MVGPQLRNEWSRWERKLQQICRYSGIKDHLPSFYENANEK